MCPWGGGCPAALELDGVGTAQPDESAWVAGGCLVFDFGIVVLFSMLS